MSWAREFLARYCPCPPDQVSLEIRVGDPDDHVDVARTGADLIALGWEQTLAAGRAAVVRAALEQVRIPVLLIAAVAVDTAATRDRRQ